MTQREAAIHRLTQRLHRRGSPRLHMLTLVAATAACGLLTSFLLLNLGIATMAVRYSLAVGCAYCVFLCLVGVWLRRYRLRVCEVTRRSDSGVRFDLDLDVIEVPVESMWSSASIHESVPSAGGGGGFSGGGSSSIMDPVSASSFVRSSGPGGPSTGGGAGGWDLDLDDGALVLIPAAIIAALAFSVVIYVVYTAPTLFAELLLDAGLAAGLYKRLARIERRSWFVTVVRRTVVPAGLVAGLLATAGGIAQSVYPDTVSIGGVAHHVLKRPRQPHVVGASTDELTAVSELGGVTCLNRCPSSMR